MKLIFNPHELSDLYALRTLYDYLVSVKAPYEIEFAGYATRPHRLEMVSGLPILQNTKDKYDFELSTYSDLESPSKGIEKNVQVDSSILKNCIAPVTFEEKTALRKKYALPENQPVVVMGFALGSNSELELISSINGLAKIVIVGDLMEATFERYVRDHPNNSSVLDSLASKDVWVVNEYGTLRDYFALSDANVNARNLFYSQKTFLHNFVEGSEGGPLFMVPPEYTAQFGFKELQNAGAILAYATAAELTQAIQEYLTGLQAGQNGVRCPSVNQTRTSHLNKTRETLLPQIHAIMDWAFLGKTRPKTSLNIQEYRGNFLDATRIVHPDTCWQRKRR